MGRKRLHVTNAERQRAYRKRMQHNQKVYHRSLTIDWETPSALFATLHAEFCFTLDVCATASNAKCPAFFSMEDDGLAQPHSPLRTLAGDIGTPMGWKDSVALRWRRAV